MRIFRFSFLFYLRSLKWELQKSSISRCLEGEKIKAFFIFLANASEAEARAKEKTASDVFWTMKT